ncbi:MAG: SMI1/KNR4 family protein [Planctomycetia bacterium]|nr:SMI1/KNR4 family protein [Planctomycetia bacterium]
MAKRKKAVSQDEVFDRVRASRAPEDVWPSVPEAELDAAEAALGVPLPASYRAFAMRFGLGGEFWGLYRLPALFNQSKKLQPYGVINWTRWMQDNIVDEFGTNMSLPQKQLRRFVFFGDDCGGGNFAWDTGNPTSKKPVEYPVYYYPRSGSRIDRLADTFTGFVAWVDADWRGITDDEVEKTAPHTPWTPSHTRKKKKPLKRDVKLWLACNNNTARDLALSIRDAGRTDAFPILADALEEAGCANADLLDSCRTGDPDIDGAWVLQVLLGKA